MTNYKLVVPFGIAVLAIAGIMIGTIGFSAISSANKLSENPMMLGHLILVAKDKDGNIKAYRQTDNIVVATGKNCALVDTFGVPGNGTATACGGVTTNQFRQIAIGTGTTTEMATDTVLTAQTGGRATNGTYTLINSTATTPSYTIQTTFRPGTTTIAEAGIFDAASGGHMFAHKTFTGIALGTSDTLTVTWRISLS